MPLLAGYVEKSKNYSQEAKQCQKTKEPWHPLLPGSVVFTIRFTC